MKINLFFKSCELVLGTLLLLLTVSPSSVQATRRLPYACNSDICSPEREEYRRRAMGMACSAERRLTRLITQLDRKKRDLQEAEQRLQRCLLNPRRNFWGCPYLWNRVFGLTQAVMRIQAQINRMLRQLSASCDSSFPAPGRGRNPTQCEQDEASKYCPIGSLDKALLSVSQRCMDLRLEAGNALLNCNPPCIIPPNLALVIESDPPVAAFIAGVPTCEVPQTPTVIPTVPTVAPTVVPTVVPTVEPNAIATPLATTVPTSVA
jgi:hypothetical protein